MQWPEVSKSIGNLVGPIPFHCGEKTRRKMQSEEKARKNREMSIFVNVNLKIIKFETFA